MRRSLLALPALFALLIGVQSSAVAVRPIVSNSQSSGAPSSGAIKDQLVGAWQLVHIEQRNANGQLVAPVTSAGGANASRTGYLIYDAAGYVAVSIMPLGRKKYSGPQPTDGEAKAALTGFTGYFGTFSIDEKERAVTHHLQGSVNPRMAPNQKRFFELSGNRLTLQPPPAANGNRTRLTWERMPELPDLTAEHRRFLGFWKLVSNERRNQTGELVASNPGQTGYIIYTPAGLMMVHMMRPARKPYAGEQPTPQEARQAIGTYTNYFGPFYIHEGDGYVVHDQLGTLNVGRLGPSPQQRFYQFVGSRLLLKPPPTYTSDGQTIQGTITWEYAGGSRGTP
jgi:hypothetical protein